MEVPTTYGDWDCFLTIFNAWKSCLDIGISRQEFLVFGEEWTLSVDFNSQLYILPTVCFTMTVFCAKSTSSHFKAQTSPILIPVQRANSTPIFCGVGCSSKWRINIRWWFNDNVGGSLFSVWVGYSISHSSKWKIPCLFPYLITDLSTATISRTVFLANPEVHLSITNCWTSFSVIFSAAPNRGNRCVCNVSWYAHRVECFTIGRFASHQISETSWNVFLLFIFWEN